MQHNRGRWFGGLVLIALGAFFMLSQLGYIDISMGELFRTFWPAILIIIGLNSLLHGAFWGVILLGVGGYFLLSNLGYIYMSPGDFFKMLFPLALIVGGVWMLFKKRDYSRPDRERHRRKDWKEDDWGYDAHTQAPPPPPPPPTDYDFDSKFDEQFGTNYTKKEPKKSDFHGQSGSFAGSVPPPPPMGGMSGSPKRDTLHKSAFIGDTHLGSDYWELKPTNLSHFIGDTFIDLTKAQVPYGETKITVSSFIGDVKVFVPNDMDLGVSVTSSSFLGDVKIFDQKKDGFMSSVQMETPYFYEAGKKIRIVVSTFIGDVKVTRVG